MAILSSIFGGESGKFINKANKIVNQINALEADISSWADEAFPKKTGEFRARLKAAADDKEKNKILEEILPEAFAMVREAMKRVDGKRLFDVQMIGGLALNAGHIAEMKTGEGKTFVAVLPAYLNALS